MAVSPSTSSTAAVPINPSLQKFSLQRMPQAAVVPQQLPQRTLTLQSTQPVVSTSDTKRSLASMWREIQGVDDWSGLVDPLNSLLRQEVVRYGELVIACYKAFDVDPSSKRYLSCKYGRSRMLNEVGLSSAGYEITRYIYATPGISILSPPDARRGRWIGYVAVSSSAHRLGRRDILVAFRGTVTAAEWAANFMSSLTPAALDPLDPRRDVKVESGFLSLYTTADPTAARLGHGSCREQLLGELRRLIEHHKGEEMSITVAGHSMGSALALLLGYDLAELGLNRGAPVAVYSFGGPRVGNAGFKRRMEELGVKVLRVVNVRDPVTKLPGLFLNEGWRVWLPWSGEECYEHVGVELALDFFQLRDYPACVHDLDNYLGTLLRGKKCSRVVRGSREGLNAVAPPTERVVAKRRTRFEGWEYWMDAAFRVVGDWVKSLRLVEL